MIHYDRCPVCNAANISAFALVEDHSVSGEKFEILQCNECTLRFTQDIPEAASIGKYYASEDYISHSDTKKGLVNRLYHSVRNITLRTKKKLIISETKKLKGSILDIGSGTGAFLNEMKSAGWNVTGIEADASARERSKKSYSISPATPEALFTQQQKFDVITMWHVLEHVHRLHDYIAECKKLLQKDGVFIVAVPNYTSKDASHYKEAWAAYDVPRHLYHFSPKSIGVLMEKHGLNVDEIKPMWFDSYYVSMLSEKYKKGNLLSALVNGAMSNLNALSAKSKCSSVIYIIRASSI